MRPSEVEQFLNCSSLEEVGKEALRQAGMQFGARALYEALNMYRARRAGVGIMIRHMLAGYMASEKNYPLTEDVLLACMGVDEVLENLAAIMEEAYPEAWRPVVYALCVRACDDPEGECMAALIGIIPLFGWSLIEMVMEVLPPSPALVSALREQCVKVTTIERPRFEKWAKGAE